MQSREEVRELSVLRRKTQTLEQSNAELLAKMIRAQYKDKMSKSMTYDDIGPHLLSMWAMGGSSDPLEGVDTREEL